MGGHDVLIVGAGPAGSWAAFRLARAGCRVTLIDGSHPREKPCGGGITGRALYLVRSAISPAAFPSVRIARAGFTHRGRSAQVRLSDGDQGYPPLLVASRREFDAALLEAAIGAGARHEAARVVALEQTDAGWRARTRNGSFEAPWMLGADGANSLVRRATGQQFPRAELSVATGYFAYGPRSRDIEVSFEDDPPGYLWSFPRPDHLAVGICAQADSTTSSTLRVLVNRWIDANAPRARLERYSWPIPTLTEPALDRERPAGRGWMLLGDAAGLVDPITREGIYFALRSADAAADALLDGSAPSTAYVDQIRAEIHAELIRAARLKAGFFQPRFISLLVSALSRSGRVREIMADLVAGQQTYRGLRRRLLGTFEWRLMLELFGH